MLYFSMAREQLFSRQYSIEPLWYQTWALLLKLVLMSKIDFQPVTPFEISYNMVQPNSFLKHANEIKKRKEQQQMN